MELLIPLLVFGGLLYFFWKRNKKPKVENKDLYLGNCYAEVIYIDGKIERIPFNDNYDLNKWYTTKKNWDRKIVRVRPVGEPLRLCDTPQRRLLWSRK